MRRNYLIWSGVDSCKRLRQHLSSMKSFPAWRGLALCVALLAFGLTIYRGNTQTIAHDEAMEYELFLDGGVSHVLGFHPTNHVLFTLLAKPIVWVLGNREIVLRSLSVLGTFVYLLAAYLLCRRLFRLGAMLFLSMALLSLNPQVLDFMAAARGYILGLAAIAVAMYLMAVLGELGEFRPADRAWKWGCAVASVSLAFSMAANLTNMVPAVCLGFAFSAVAMGSARSLFDIGDQRLREFVRYFFLPGAATFFCILWPYLIQARPAHFYVGQTQAIDSLRGVFQGSLLYKWTDDIYSPSLGALPAQAGSWQGRVTNLGVFVLLPLLLCTVAAGVILARRRTSAAKSNEGSCCRIFGNAALGSVALIVVLHVIAGVHYPESRLCLFLIPLFTVSGLLAAREIQIRFPWLLLRTIGIAVALVVTADYALSIQTKSFRYNAYDIISRDLYRAIEKDARSRGLQEARVGGTWWYEPEINFYRVRYGAKWMLPYDVKDPSSTWQTPGTPDASAYDYFVFTPANDSHLSGPRIRTIFHDDKTQATIIAIGHD